MSKPELAELFYVVCITLKDRSDRRRALLANLKACHWPFAKPSWWWGMTPKQVKMPADYREREVPGGHAAMCSHMAVAGYAVTMQKKGRLVLVMEDDCEFTKDFVVRFKEFINGVPDDWDCLMLGWLPSGIGPKVLNHRVGLANYNMGTHCYVMREPMLSEYLRRLRQGKAPADYVLASMMVEYKVYIPYPMPLCKQADGVSSVSGKHMRKVDAFGTLSGRDAPSITIDIPKDQIEGEQEIMSGEYEPHRKFDRPPMILDIGANVGVFATWALNRFPGCTLACFEPMPKNLKYLRKNVKGTKAMVVGMAVTSQAPKNLQMYDSDVNCGCCSAFDVGQQNLKKSVLVDTVHPSALPDCDILKIDTEGNELDILYHYQYKPAVVMVEYHRELDRSLIDSLLVGRGYTLRELRVGGCGKLARGVAKYWRIA